MATNFLAYSSWSLSCTGMQDNVPGDCNSGLATLITYVYENVFPESVSRSQLRPDWLLLPQAYAPRVRCRALAPLPTFPFCRPRP